MVSYIHEHQTGGQHYEPPNCMMKSSYRNAFAIFKFEQEQANMNEAEAPGACYFVRKKQYKFSDDEGEDEDNKSNNS